MILPYCINLDVSTSLNKTKEIDYFFQLAGKMILNCEVTNLHTLTY